MEPSQKTKDQRTRKGNQPRRPGNFPPTLDQGDQRNETVPFSNTAQPLSSEEDPQRDSYERHDREIDREDDRMMSLSEGDEEPKINSKRKNFGKRESFDEQEAEEGEGEEGPRTPTNFFSLSESLKAMKNLRNNFQSFELEVDAKDFEGADFEDANKEILEEEEDYIKVDSVEDDQIRELDYEVEKEEHGEEYYEEEVPEKQARTLHDQFIEKIQEEAYEESRREDDEQDLNRNDEGQIVEEHVSSGEKILDTDDFIEPSRQEGFDLEGTENKVEEILQDTQNKEEPEVIGQENKKLEEDVEEKPVEEVEEEKKENILVEPEVIENKPSLEDERKRFLEEFELGGAEKEKEKEPEPEPKPEPQQEAIPEVREVFEESPLEKPPMFMPVRKAQEARKSQEVEKPKRAAPFIPRVTLETETFVPQVQVNANLNVEAKVILTSDSPVIVEEEVDLQGMNEEDLIVYLKKIQVELKKERKMNRILENEHKKVLTENTELKKEVFTIKTKFEALEKSKENEKLARKDQQTIEKLQEELNNTIEGSKLAKEQSSKLMKESLQLKQEMESMIDSLTEETKQQENTIRELKSLLHKEKLRNETLSQEVTHYEQRVKDYEESFDLIRNQSKEREKTVKELTTLSETSVSALQSLPKIEEIVEKLQPQRATIGVQASFGQTFSSKDHSLNLSKRSEQEEQSKSMKLSPENKPRSQAKATGGAWALASEPESQKKEVIKEEKKVSSEDFFGDLIEQPKKDTFLPKVKKVEVKEKEHKSPLKPTLQKKVEVESFIKEHQEPEPEPRKTPVSSSLLEEKKPLIITKEKEEEPVKKEPLKLKPKTSETTMEGKIEKKQEPSVSLAQEKSPSISFPTLPAAEEIKKKPIGGLVLNKTPTLDQQKSPIVVTKKPALTVNLNNIANKSSSRYTTQVKTINKNMVSTEADNFFDELGISDTPQSRGGGLRESVTSLRSSTSKQGGESSTKKSLNLNNFV